MMSTTCRRTYKHPKLPYPKPTPLPAFEPLQINNYDAPGTPNIPPGLDQHDPVALFRLFFTDEMVEKMVRWTNEYAKDHRPSKGSATSIAATRI
ncbi:uncharacterized protein BDZ99DRAFT_13689 [Mytilinidion resinicola]|uniref:PiggyBac transposable element-derived protein domain-containing protein n=1 Tax=Mytilinidion resinicola TaxID=574789 RepID=A0A6A6Z882_9PEZI|nr:uncharacterized protein BDZ99DRAFT_13689 [Mytilinidion resinicola]KAF2817332.1 hypothetical protein BDZ99DRAFT_13689 [Mytilinidion resinicola]